MILMILMVMMIVLIIVIKISNDDDSKFLGLNCIYNCKSIV